MPAENTTGKNENAFIRIGQKTCANIRHNCFSQAPNGQTGIHFHTKWRKNARNLAVGVVSIFAEREVQAEKPLSLLLLKLFWLLWEIRVALPEQIASNFSVIRSMRVKLRASKLYFRQGRSGRFYFQPYCAHKDKPKQLKCITLKYLFLISPPPLSSSSSAPK